MRRLTKVRPYRERVAIMKGQMDGHYQNSMASLQRQGGDTAKRARLRENARSAGKVFLVGAGPGNPDLLTLRALRVLLEADVIVYDRLASAEIVALGRAEAERVYAGKERDHHCMPQSDISRLLVALARQNKKVVRLKGGDPFIFGRGGEEAQVLAEHGIDFEIVPGVTAACGVAAFAGIPLTHRDYAHSCVFVAGHLKDGSMNLDWQALCRPNQTLVVYMGLLGLPVLCRELAAHGMPTSTPAAMVQQGSTPGQRVVVGTIACLPQRVAVAGLVPPALTIVGEVVRLREQLAWFDGHETDVTLYASL